MSAYTETKAVADAGLAAGQSLWAAMEAAYAASESLQHKRLVRTFDCALEAITDELGDEAKLFGAFARKAIPGVMLIAADRKAVTSAADDAWGEYHNARVEDRAEQAADFSRDARRDDRWFEIAKSIVGAAQLKAAE